MQVLHACCSGLDVHKKTVMACVRQLSDGGRVRQEVREFGTMTSDILGMADWLADHGVTHVAMESTGVFWKPIYNLLDGRFVLLLCNAHHIKQVPGRKTDVKDCQWIAQLLQHGLLKPSFVPPRPMRELRDLTRHRAQIVDEKTRIVNRIHKTLEDANIKLAAVASDILGVSGRDMLQSLIEGVRDPQVLADKARRRLRGKIPQLREALHGHVTEHHRYMLRLLFKHLQFLESDIEDLGNRIASLMTAHDTLRPVDAREGPGFDDAIELLVEIPGIDRLTAENVLAEIGTNMAQFPSASHLASWTGLCPGNDESAGKRRSGKTAKGSRWARRALSQGAWAASRTKNTYFAALFRRLAARRGKKRAAVAVAHALLVTIYHLLSTRSRYTDLGPDHFDRLHPERTRKYLVRRLEELGYQVNLTAKESA